MSSAIAMADYKKIYGMTSVVMCPGTLCEKWKRTLDAEIPFAETYIIENVFDVIKLRDKIRDKNRKTNLWLIVSKDKMKTNYAVRPAARWKKKVKCINTEYGYPINMDTYVCPECGQPLFTKKNVRRASRKREVRTYFNETAFVSQNATNKACMNTIRKYNNKKHKWEEVECGAPLWRACNKVREGDYTGDSVEWIKVGNDMGWVEPQHMNKLANEYYNDRKNNAVLKKKAIALEDTINGEGIVQTAPKSYCISKYMRKYFKGCIDYAIIDEVHELAGESTLQGEAMGDIVRTAKKSLCLTGTLLNGYAKSIFYMLFRTHPATMIKEGFEYGSSGEMAFTKDFGVYKEISFDAIEGYEAKKKKGTSVKALPGASPLIYTKFLMNNAVFACIDDMADGLPGYTEIPVGIDMEPILNETHERLTSMMRTYLKGDKRNKKLMSQAALMLTVWPDQPYEQPPLIDPETKHIKCVPPEYKLGINGKDDKCLEIIRANIAQGRKVMVYYAYPGRTDVDRRLPELLNNEGIKTSVLLSKRPDNFQGRMPKWMGAPSANGREAWIGKQIEDGCQVLFVNPKLIQTGLDLISFSTIIFYQVGYNLSDMRQASRRSWRLGQTENVEVYFLYYKHTVQETIMSMMATKLQAAKAIEGKFSEEGLQAMSNNIDILNAVAASVADGVQKTLDIDAFKCNEKTVHNDDLVHKKMKKNLIDVEREYKYMSRPTLKIRTTRKAYDRANEMNMLSKPEKLFAAM